MRPSSKGLLRRLSLLFLLTFTTGFSVVDQHQPPPPRLPAAAGESPLRARVPTVTKKIRSAATTLFQESSAAIANDKDGNSARPPNVPKVMFTLNAATKWLVTLANTVGIWTTSFYPRLDYKAPFIIVGAIAASSYLTPALKTLINQSRPSGAPFTDPGMPSSHSLVSFFLAAAWTSLVFTIGTAPLLIWAGAASVALLRVICGYHSWDQIGVGAILGASMGFGWARLGASVLYPGNPQLMVKLSWGLYLAGSVLYICKDMKEWTQKGSRHL